MVQGVFILHEPCCFSGVEGSDIHFRLMILMRGKNLLHFIKERQNIHYNLLISDKYIL